MENRIFFIILREAKKLNIYIVDIVVLTVLLGGVESVEILNNQYIMLTN